MHEKADSWASFEKKARLQEAHALFYLIGRISPIFNQKCHLLDFSLIFVYGFTPIDFQLVREFEIQRLPSHAPVFVIRILVIRYCF